ncbi:hypothetical protein COM90_02225 [Bacillus thuringiensis]|uniref:Uncharacterized protein n=1 Tax=Bacillus thuringiensis TaxID=1428 RepID=A0AB36TNR0_BACTU|nr:DUF6414 family protein [Bacillus thuringiensis]PEE61278.1 hypothetical protein COM74_30520 [Bacillus thuringiensis]PEE90429.1 hypothetical protein COM90_02225 [Bacillus thuringiensis]PFM84990.1 hypothetical protein COJ61_28690 [Bacillus thuringiensis]
MSGNNKSLVKVVYFDEGSATDYLTILNGGSFLGETQKTKKKGHEESGEVAVRLKALFDVFFVKGSAETTGKVKVNNLGETLIKSTISNTILSDFFDVLPTSDDNDNKIVKLSGYKISMIKNSVAYFQTITPYLSMTDGNVQVAEEVAFNISRMHETFKSAKGYYELLAKDFNSEKILRFNNQAFKNNYNITDLEQMDLVFYGVQVGTMNISSLDFTKAFETENEIMMDLGGNESDGKLPVFDIILAGIE